VELVQRLQLQDWIDDNRTRAVRVEFALYNPNVNLFVASQIQWEVSPLPRAPMTILCLCALPHVRPARCCLCHKHRSGPHSRALMMTRTLFLLGKRLWKEGQASRVAVLLAGDRMPWSLLSDLPLPDSTSVWMPLALC
jgi:hypothetical protein